MKSHEIELLLSRILCGYVFYRRKKVKMPDQHVLYRASFLYKQIYDKCLAAEIIEDSYDLLISAGLWTPEKEKQLKEILPKHIEEWKVCIYENRFQSKKQNEYRELLRKAEEGMFGLLRERHVYDMYTCSGIATYSKRMFIARQIYKGDSEQLSVFLDSNSITDKQYRQIVKSDVFSAIWPAHKKSRFIKSHTEDQKRLLMWASFYDNIRKIPEINDSIISDDDCLDGLLIKKRRENKEEIQVGKDGDDVFLPADTQADAERIYNMNSYESRNIIRSRLNKIQQSGEVREQDFADYKHRLMMEFNKMKGTS